MICHRCNNNQILRFGAKCSDLFDATYQAATGPIDYSGYVPYNLNIGGGDYIELAICMNCGQTQGTFPVPEETVIEKLRD